MDNLNTVTVPREDIGTICDVVETIFQHSKNNTKTLKIGIDKDITLKNWWASYKTWKDKIVATDVNHDNYLTGLNFTVKKQGSYLIVTFA